GPSGRGSDFGPRRPRQEGDSCSLSSARTALPPAWLPNAVLDAPRGSWSAGHEGECYPRGRAFDPPPDVAERSGCAKAGGRCRPHSAALPTSRQHAESDAGDLLLALVG